MGWPLARLRGRKSAEYRCAAGLSTAPAVAPARRQPRMHAAPGRRTGWPGRREQGCQNNACVQWYRARVGACCGAVSPDAPCCAAAVSLVTLLAGLRLRAEAAAARGPPGCLSGKWVTAAAVVITRRVELRRAQSFNLGVGCGPRWNALHTLCCAMPTRAAPPARRAPAPPRPSRAPCESRFNCVSIGGGGGGG